MKALLLSLLLTLAAIQNPAPAGTGAIEGRVLRSGTGEPVANMPITLIESTGISEEAAAGMLDQIASLGSRALQSQSRGDANTAGTCLHRLIVALIAGLGQGEEHGTRISGPADGSHDYEPSRARIEDFMTESVREGDAQFKESLTRQSQPAWLWAFLLVVAGVPRVLLAFRLPNPDGDAYSYLYTINEWRASLVAGTFSVKTLRDFWLPLYQFLCALISSVINHPVYVSKLVSAACGIGICALVFLITLRLTANRMASLTAALLVALNPLHILFSAFSMTEIPHALFVLGSLYAALTRRWLIAAVWAAFAGFTRVESWMLIPMLPAFEFLVRGRISIRVCVVLLIAPLLWLYICWAATGDVLFYFHMRSLYVRDSIAADSARQVMSADRLWRNGGSLIRSVNPVVLISCFFGTGWLIRQRWLARLRDHSEDRLAAEAVAVCFFAYLGFLVAAFLSGNQPDIWDRYGLISFATGMPLAAWTYLQITHGRPRLALVLPAAILAVYVSETHSQIEDARNTIRQTSTKQIIANSLNRYYQKDANLRILNDDTVLPTITRIPAERFSPSSNLPTEPAAVLAELHRRGITYIVYQRDEVRSPMNIFPGLQNGISDEHFELEFPKFTTDFSGNAYLFRFCPSGCK